MIGTTTIMLLVLVALLPLFSSAFVTPQQSSSSSLLVAVAGRGVRKTSNNDNHNVRSHSSTLLVFSAAANNSIPPSSSSSFGSNDPPKQQKTKKVLTEADVLARSKQLHTGPFQGGSDEGGVEAVVPKLFTPQIYNDIQTSLLLLEQRVKNGRRGLDVVDINKLINCTDAIIEEMVDYLADPSGCSDRIAKVYAAATASTTTLVNAESNGCDTTTTATAATFVATVDTTITTVDTNTLNSIKIKHQSAVLAWMP
jgi:hypothetical protein